MRVCLFITFSIICFLTPAVETLADLNSMIEEAKAAITARLRYNQSRLHARTLEGKTLTEADDGIIQREVEVYIDEQQEASAALFAQGEKPALLNKNNEILEFFLKILERIKLSPTSEKECLQNTNNLGALCFYIFVMSNGPEYEKSNAHLRHKGGTYWTDILTCIRPFFSDRAHLLSCLQSTTQGTSVEGIDWQPRYTYEPEALWKGKIQELEAMLTKKKKKKKKETTALEKLRTQLNLEIRKFIVDTKRSLKCLKRGKEQFAAKMEETTPPLFMKRIGDVVSMRLIPAMDTLENPDTMKKFQELLQRGRRLNELELTQNTAEIEALAANLPQKTAKKAPGLSSTSSTPDTPLPAADADEAETVREEKNPPMEEATATTKDIVATASTPTIPAPSQERTAPPLFTWNIADLPSWAKQLNAEAVPVIEEVVAGMQETFDPNSQGTWKLKQGDIRLRMPNGHLVHFYFHYPFAEPKFPAWKFNFLDTLARAGYPCSI